MNQRLAKLLSVLFVLMGLYYIKQGTSMLRFIVMDLTNWKQVDAEIIESRIEGTSVEQATMISSDGPSVFVPRILFSYNWAGKKMTSDKINYFGIGTGWRTAFKWTSRYEIGTTWQAWVNPQKPTEAILVKDSPKKPLLKASIGLVLLLMAAFISVGFATASYS